MIAANQVPDHTTIARFRARHADELAELFSEVLVLCRKARPGLGRHARPRRHPDRRRRRRSEEPHLRATGEGDPRGGRRGRRRRGRALRRQARRRAARRSQQPPAKASRRQAPPRRRARGQAGGDGRLGGRDGRAHRAYRLRAQEQPAQAAPDPPKEGQRINVTDPDSRPVKTRHGFIQGYTAQAAATAEQVIVARRVDRRCQRAPPPRANGEGRRGRAHQGRGDREARARPRRRRLLEWASDRRARAQRNQGPSARPTPTAARHRRRSDRAPTTSECEGGFDNPRPRRPTGEDSRWSSRSLPRSSCDRGPRGSHGEGYPRVAPSGV